MMEAPSVTEVMKPPVEEAGVVEEKVDVRLSIEWEEEDRDAIDFIKKKIDEGIRREYAQVFAEEEHILQKVRIPNPPGSVPGWQRNPDGSYMEDWSRLTVKDMEEFIQAGSSEVFFSAQKSVNNYAEAVFAKFTYDDAYDQAYSSQLSGTIGDKTARAKRRTQKERWLALFKSLYYKRSQEVVSNLESHVRRVERIYTERKKDAERAFRASKGI